MPVFEYQCDKCGQVFEKLLFQEEGEVHCSRCGGTVHKLMSTFAIDVPDEICGKLPRGERRDVCKECKFAGAG